MNDIYYPSNASTTASEDPKWPLIKGLIPIVMISAIATAGAIYWAVRAVWG